MVYKADPKFVVDVLLKIMDEASAEDSVLAAGYAMELVNGPGVGVVCVEHFDKKTYDDIDKDWDKTPRQHWIKKVKAYAAGQPAK